MSNAKMMERIAGASPCLKARIAGLLGEGSVMLWLLVISVNVQRWKEQASVAERR
jgi:hypothetical protein